VDGIPGPITLTRARRALPEVLGEFCARRAWRYEINRNEDAFGKGWFRRLFRLFATARDWSRTP
jgi:lysozyme family protein